MAHVSSKHASTQQVALSFSGGVNLSLPPTALSDGQLAQALNVHYPPGEQALTTRTGLTHAAAPVTLSGAPVPIAGLHYYRKSTDEGILLAAMADSRLYRLDEASGTAYWNLVGDLAPLGTAPAFLTYGGVCLIADGGAALKRFDGDALTAIEGSPSGATALAEAGGRVACNSAGDPDGVIFSSVWDETGWDVSAGAILIRAGYRDALAVTALGMLGSDMIVFKGGDAGGMIYRLATAGSSSSWSVAPLSRNNTALNPQAVVSVGNNLYFGARAGVLDLAGTLEYGDIKVGLSGAPVNAALNAKQVRQLAYLPGLAVMLALVENDPSIYVHHPLIGAWTVFNYQDEPMLCACQAGESAYLGGLNGRLYRVSAGEDGDEIEPGVKRPITTSVRTRTLSFPGQAVLKSVRLYAETVSAGSGELSVSGRDQVSKTTLMRFAPASGPGLLHDALGQVCDAGEKLGAASLGYAGVRSRFRDQAFCFQVRTSSGRIKMRQLTAALAQTAG